MARSTRQQRRRNRQQKQQTQQPDGQQQQQASVSQRARSRQAQDKPRVVFVGVDVAGFAVSAPALRWLRASTGE
mgnify:CR=1 FL=1